jgi:predicted dehydrogenase
MKTLRVGIIGASAEGGWAREGHVPAVQGLAGLELVAVATNSQKTADAAAKAFGVPGAYGSGRELIRAGGIDLVTVATRVTDHRELVLAAIDAGLHVYSEWPLGRGVAEAEEMAAAARRAGIHAAIGLQLRGSPVVRRARDLIASGALGRVLSVSTYAATAGFGPDVPAPSLYLEDPANFANLVTIQGAHTIDLAIALAGALGEASALATAQYPEINPDGERRQRVTFDHLLVQGRLAAGGTVSAEVAGGRPPATPFHLEVVGERGILRLDGGAPARLPVRALDAFTEWPAAARGRRRIRRHAGRGRQRRWRLRGPARRHR